MPHDGIFVNALEAIRHGQGDAVRAIIGAPPRDAQPNRTKKDRRMFSPPTPCAKHGQPGFGPGQ
jgi:hypothetical protein